MSATLSELEEIARRCRIEIVNMVYRAQAGHPGGSLSEIDLMTALSVSYTHLTLPTICSV